MEKRTLLAIIFALLVMVTYSYFMQKLYPDQKKTLSFAEKTVSNQQKAEESLVRTMDASNKKDTVPTLLSQTRKVSGGDVEYEFSDIGGCIKSIKVMKYNLSRNQEPELIYSSELAHDAIFSITGLSDTEDLQSAQYNYTATDDGIIYSFLLKNGIEIKKIYKIQKNNYGIELELKIRNLSGKKLDVGYSIVAGSEIQPISSDSQKFITAVISLSGKNKRLSPRQANARPEEMLLGKTDWVSLQNKYFSIATKPYQETLSSTLSPTESALSKQNKPNYNLKFNYENIPMEQNETVVHRFLLYSGPNNMDTMSSYGVGIENSLNFGAFDIISKLMLSGLHLFYKIFHNYGLAIILLSLIISMCLYPLTFKSIRSMKQMQILQPKISRLQKELKGNPQKLNREIMEMYKKHKVNPFGGCLPMLLQMPIFIALYQALNRAIELKNAGFLWVSDLSQPDRLFSFHLASGGNFYINILPILMAILMYFQQKISMVNTSASAEGDNAVQQQQKMMTIFMPILFGFIFYNMPSGLVLYWFVNTLIMFFQQMSILKRFHVEECAVL